MKKKKLLLYVQSALCVLWVLFMAAAAVILYCRGAAEQAQGNPEVWIFTREKAIAVFAAGSPLLLATLAVTVFCAVKGICDGKQDKPVPDPDLIRIYKAERRAAQKGVPGAYPSGTAGSLRAVRIGLFVLAAVLIAAGICNGSMEDTLIKAVNICTECIGLG